jgi:hypothetical protein
MKRALLRRNWEGVKRLLVVLSLTACATMPTQKEIDKADYGSPISQDLAEAKAKEFLSGYLKDPMSATYQWKAVYQGWFKGFRRATVYGYILDGNINAKNSYGGYVGASPFRFVFRNGELVSAYMQKEMNGTSYYSPIL